MPPPALQLPLDPTLASVIEGTTLPLLYVGFGSMEKFILDVNWKDVFETLESGVHAYPRPGVIHRLFNRTAEVKKKKKKKEKGKNGYEKSAGQLE